MLDAAGETPIQGIGGTATYWTLPGSITIAGTDTSGHPATWTYPVELHVAVPTDHNQAIPSILGRDVLNHWRQAIATDAGMMRFAPKGQPDAHL